MRFWENPLCPYSFLFQWHPSELTRHKGSSWCIIGLMIQTFPFLKRASHWRDRVNFSDTILWFYAFQSFEELVCRIYSTNFSLLGNRHNEDRKNIWYQHIVRLSKLNRQMKTVFYTFGILSNTGFLSSKLKCGCE